MNDNKLIKLIKVQIKMLQLSDEDIKAGRIILQEQADKDDLNFPSTLRL